MRVTPIDIAHKSFGKKMFGLDQEEVMDFLQQVASQMETLIHERNALKESMRERDLALAEYKDRDKVLKDTIATASQMSDRLRQDADREARLIIADAQQKAEIIMRDSRDSLKKMYQEITDLKRARLQFEANLKALVQAHLSLIEQGEKYMPQMQLPNVAMNENAAPRSTGVSPLTAG
ncbi:MAG: DivIVA domain-containing protein [Bdellovibrionaceae bacterium]|nr:DivIVA domain-containing protein [Pseudobdellovibrionaceae bacterium]MBX3032720.1 DivIVA domain-containing protein [Pseudobdellovibrionaceae bacterium]